MNQESHTSLTLSPIHSRRSKLSGCSTYITQSLSYSFPNQRRNTVSSLRVHGQIYTFGKDSPKWTIPSSRPQKDPQVQSPGPGEYDISSSLVDRRRIYQRMSLTSQEKIRPPLTASIGFIDRPSLVNQKSGIVIGKREKFDFAQITPNPGPGTYSPQTSRKYQSHIIASRHDITHSNENPGPGSYEISRSISVRQGGSLPGSPINRAQWMSDGIEKTPDPSKYYTISNNHFKKKNVIAIDRCIVKLDKVEEPKKAQKYLQANQKLKDIIHEIYDVILDPKPKDPLSFLREYFLPERPPPLPTEEEEDYLLY